ncbi:MAG: hypothetical protein LBV55_02565 [Acholeplasmatales bacterium]|jgi:hypothetical protein|nr:hypothetical protein [Acholeplasmatales bacterium]
MKKLFLILLSVLCIGTLYSCQWLNNFFNPSVKLVEDYNVVISERRTADFINYADEYHLQNSSTTIYYLDNEGVPYVDIQQMFNLLKGFLHSEVLYYRNISNHETKIYYYVNLASNPLTCILNYQQDSIEANTYNFFQYYVYQSENTNAAKYLSLSGSTEYGDQSIKYSLQPYGFNVLAIKDEGEVKSLMPLSIFSMIFLSAGYYSLYYNGTTLNGVDLINDKNSAFYEAVRQGEYNDTNKSPSLINATYQSFIFGLDYFYGLREDPETSYRNLISQEYQNLMLSTNKEDNTLGYSSFVYQYLNEGHSSYQGPSLYDSPNAKFNLQNVSELGSRMQERYQVNQLLNEKFSQRFNGALTTDDLYSIVPAVRYQNNTAIIYLDQFNNGVEEEIYNSDGTYRSEAYKSDADALLNKAMTDIQTHPNVDKVILDISRNPGGNLGALLRVLGYLTDEPIRNAMVYNYTRSLSITNYLTDTNRDQNPANDAYSEYNWYLLISPVSYSAANIAASIFSNMNLGTIIGQKSGGGACGILPLILADGSTIVISGPNKFVTANEFNDSWIYWDNELGIFPNIYIDYKNFYDDAYLESILN